VVLKERLFIKKVVLSVLLVETLDSDD
jgi:hypothetical protein